MRILKEDLKNLYFSGKSMVEIAKDIRCSHHKVVYWMNKFNIKRRTRSEAMYVKLNPSGDPFQIKKTFNFSEAILYGLGIGIYWGEGDKVNPHLVRVANTDPEILKTFIKFLLNICQLEKRKLSYGIVCFNDTDSETARRYWAVVLGISPERFGKIVQIPTQGKGTYKKKSRFGVCTVAVGSIRLKAWIIGELDKIKKEGLDSIVVKQALGKG